MRRQSFQRVVILAVTVALSWAGLAFGLTDEGAGGPGVGDVATRDYFASSGEIVEDTVATDSAKNAARESVVPVLVKNERLEEVGYERVDSIVKAVRDAVIGPVPSLEQVPAPTDTVPPSSTTTAADASSTTAVVEEIAIGTIAGSVFIDVNGDGFFDGSEIPADGWTTDRGWPEVVVVAVAQDGTLYPGTTDQNGAYSIEVPQGDYRVILDSSTGAYPEGFVESTTDVFSQALVCDSDDCEAEPVGLTAAFRPIEGVVEQVEAESLLLGTSSWTTLAEYGSRDIYRDLFGASSLLETISAAASDRLAGFFRPGIESDQLEQKRQEAQSDVTSVVIDDVPDALARDVVNQLVTVVLVSNMETDIQATEAAKAAAAEDVASISVNFGEGAVVISSGETFTQLTLDAVTKTGANLDKTVRSAATAGILVVLVAVLGFYLARFRKVYWDRPRMVALLGMLIVLAAGAVRLTVQFQEASSWYILPAVAFGYLAGVLFDNRMGTLMALAMGVLALLGSSDPGLGVYAALATLAPIGFVSSVSSRRAFRNSVLVSALAAGVIAASASWLFEAQLGESPLQQVWRDAAWAAAVALLASLVALAAMPFFEALFDITTTLRLLELTDRNHEALQLLQEKAFGSFNHSLMVGTLAGAAAKAIGANNLLARAAAYYHDIGKTEAPLFFIENQFGASNPHDDLDPTESARIIRQHVLDGVQLARRHKIPSEVAEGIVSHHGDGIMRYFYEKARQIHGEDNVDPDDFRHAGHKPRSREMAILMMADAVEGACRAVFAEEEPKPESIVKVVNRVIDEKVGDGQLTECDLTMGELTTVRRAFIEALTGHYHQRIPYPNFPGS